MEVGEGIKQQFKMELREIKSRFTGEMHIRKNQPFRLGWEQVGNITANIGIGKKRSGEIGINVNLTDLLPADDKTRVEIQVAKDGWVNLHNSGETPLSVLTTYSGKEYLRGTAPKAPKIDRENGITPLLAGEALTAKQGGAPFLIEWQDSQGRKITLKVEGQKNYSTGQDSIKMSYSIK